jgi:hypothetical protein
MTPDGLPVHSFRSLLADLATLARNTITTAITPLLPLTVLTRPTAIQQKAFDLLGLKSEFDTYFYFIVSIQSSRYEKIVFGTTFCRLQ